MYQEGNLLEQVAQSKGSVIAFGELLWDVLPQGAVLGGAPANFSVRISEHGIPVYLVSRTGSDELGERARGIIAEREVDLSLLQVDPQLPTGTVDVTFAEGGEPDYIINTGVAYDAVELSEELLTLGSKAALICFGTLIQRSPVSRATLYALLDAAPAAIKLVDVNLRKNCFSAETVRASVERATVVKLNRDEIVPVAEMLDLNEREPFQFGAALVDNFECDSCLITLGAGGAIAISRDGERVEVPGFSVAVRDTIGSGDAFTAGFAVCSLAGGSLADCCRYGNALGALAATREGGMGAVSPAEVHALLG